MHILSLNSSNQMASQSIVLPEFRKSEAKNPSGELNENVTKQLAHNVSALAVVLGIEFRPPMTNVQ